MKFQDVFAKRFFSLYFCIAGILVDLSKYEGDSAIYAIGSRIIHISIQVLELGLIFLIIEKFFIVHKREILF